MISIGRRVSLVVAAATLPALCGVLYNALEARRVHLVMGRARMLRAASQVAVDQATQFRDAERMLALIARLPAVRTGDRESCEASLVSIQNEDPTFAALTRVGTDLRVNCSTQGITSKAEVSSSPLIQLPLQRRSSAHGFYRLSGDSTTITASIVLPEYDAAGGLLFLVSVDLRLPWFDQQRQLGPDSGASVSVTRANSEIIMLVSGKRVFRSTRLPAAMRRQIQWVGDSAAGTYLGVGFDGRARVGAFARLPSSDGESYAASLAALSAPLLATATLSLWQQLGVLALCALIGLLVAWAMAGRYLLPDVRAVVTAAERVSRDEMSLALTRRPRTSEMASIAAAFERALERASREQRDYLALANASGDSIVRCNQHLTITDANDAVAAAEGVSRRELIGKPWASLRTAESDRRITELAERCLREGRPLEMELESRGDADRGWTNVRCVPMRDGREPVSGILIITRDTTERRMLQRQLERAQRVESVGRFAGGLAHDFNNMLTVVLSSAEMASLELPAEHPVQADLEQVRHVARRSAELTRQLLAFARRQPSKPEAIALGAYLRDSELLLKQLVGGDVDLEISVDAEVSTVWFERSQLDQVLVNLAANARDAMPHGGQLAIMAKVEPFAKFGIPEAPALAAGGYVRISVTDTGVGMTEDVVSHIFEPFYTTKPEGHGTGLGLSVVYGAVRQHGGTIWVDCEPGRGTTFHLLLQHPPNDDAVTDAQSSRPVPPPVQDHPPVLVVDDDEHVRRIVRRLIEARGYEVADAGSAEEALSLLANSGAHFRVLVTDLVMPHTNGADLVRAVIKRDPTIAIVVVSGNPDERAPLDVGMLDHIVQLAKPFTAEQLANAIESALARTPHAAL